MFIPQLSSVMFASYFRTSIMIWHLTFLLIAFLKKLTGVAGSRASTVLISIQGWRIHWDNFQPDRSCQNDTEVLANRKVPNMIVMFLEGEYTLLSEAKLHSWQFLAVQKSSYLEESPVPAPEEVTSIADHPVIMMVGGFKILANLTGGREFSIQVSIGVGYVCIYQPFLVVSESINLSIEDCFHWLSVGLKWWIKHPSCRSVWMHWGRHCFLTRRSVGI